MSSTPWIALAKNLRIGQTRKTQHCGSDRSALISHTDHGYTLHCFRCSASYFEAHGKRGLKEIMAARRIDDAIGETATMPVAAVAMMEAPPAALKWVLAGGLTPEDANDEYGFRWHEESRRVFIPTPGGLLGRAVAGERPKYRLYGRPCLYTLPGRRDSHRALVVVEDILSAIAIHRAGWPAVALLGTCVSASVVGKIAKPVVIAWFDADRAGDNAWLGLRKMLALWPTNLHRLTSKKEPKHCHRSEIVAKLEGLS